MDRIDFLADFSVRRGCAFALLAVVTVMFALCYQPSLSLRSGANLLTLMGVVLAWRAWRAPHKTCRGTELWVLLNKGADLPPNYPESQIMMALQTAYLRYAEICGGAALILCAAATITLLIGH